ncbi:MAG: anthranilate phosphoribosyltransferase [Verrucomicrobia bacterium]|nr:anthranilate phosphoribosyltransferase [Verrucomicrobiota bacterium]
MLTALTDDITAGRDLDPGAITAAVRALTDPGITPEAKADFLAALAAKGETPAEIAGFAGELRALSVPVPLSAALRQGEILDVCGTGGDRLNTFNISTTVALVCAAAGVVVAKHGNRAVTSQSGSADVLQALGVPVELSPEAAAESLERHRFAFLFAPRFHPAFQHIVPARKLCAARGQRTLFNVLGPLLNPARPTAQLLGVPRPALCEPLAHTLQTLGLRRAMVVCGEVPPPEAPADGPAYLDELSTLGDNSVAEFYQDRGFHASRGPVIGLPLQPAALSDLAGGDAATNAGIIHRLLGGEDRGPRRDAVLLNAGAALMVAGRTRSIAEGWMLAAETLDSGRAAATLRSLTADGTGPATR